jgi:hypothetical protein
MRNASLSALSSGVSGSVTVGWLSALAYVASNDLRAEK